MAFKKNSTKLQQDNAYTVFRWKEDFDTGLDFSYVQNT